MRIHDPKGLKRILASTKNYTYGKSPTTPLLYPESFGFGAIDPAAAMVNASEPFEPFEPAKPEIYAKELRFVFDHKNDCAAFVEVEDETGRSIRAGEWERRPDDLLQLVVKMPQTESRYVYWRENSTPINFTDEQAKAYRIGVADGRESAEKEHRNPATGIGYAVICTCFMIASFVVGYTLN